MASALTMRDPVTASLTTVSTKFGRVLSSVTFANASTAPVATSVIVRLNAFASPAGTA